MTGRTSGSVGYAYWTPVAGQQFEYGFDDIGNRASTKVGGDQNGFGLRSAAYTVNSVNQITQREVPSYLNVNRSRSAGPHHVRLAWLSLAAD